jgi:hypothetical protein
LVKQKIQKSKIREAAQKQEERIEELKKYLKNFSKLRKLGLDLRRKYCSILITLLEEDLIKVSKTLVIPVFKLNNFLVEIEKFV